MSVDEEDRLACELDRDIADACRGHPYDLVYVALIAALGEAIGRHTPHRDRQAVLEDAIADLTQYLSEIPP